MEVLRYPHTNLFYFYWFGFCYKAGTEKYVHVALSGNLLWPTNISVLHQTHPGDCQLIRLVLLRKVFWISYVLGIGI